jgi:hypothetical protein
MPCIAFPRLDLYISPLQNDFTQMMWVLIRLRNVTIVG